LDKNLSLKKTMNEDLITNNFIDSVDRRLLKKILTLAKVVITLNIIYSILLLIDWYLFINKSIGHSFKTFEGLYAYRIQPLIAVFVIFISTAGWIFNIKSVALLKKSVDNSDGEIFNEALRLSYRVTKLVLFSFSISILNAALRLVLHSSL
jgi:hypothetical protein